MDIIVVGDYSSSINHYEKFVYDAFASFVNNFETSEEGIRIGLIKFNDHARLVSPLTHDKKKLNEALKEFNTNSYGGTNMEEALQLALNEFTTNGKPENMKMLIMVSDGMPQNQDSVLLVASQLKDLLHIGICSVLVVKSKEPPPADQMIPMPAAPWGIPTTNYYNDNSVDAEFMQKLSSKCYVESDYENLAKELKKLDICM